MEKAKALQLEQPSLITAERSLLEGARQGDPLAQRALYDAHVDRIFRLAFRMTGVEHTARELTQDTFVRAFAGLVPTPAAARYNAAAARRRRPSGQRQPRRVPSGFREDAAFGTWLHAIAVSVTLNEIKRARREQARCAPLEEAAMLDTATPLSDPLLRERLQAAVAALPSGCRMVFLMHDADGFTHEEIAEALGVTTGTSKAQLSRGRAKLRVALADFSEEWKQ